MTWNPMILGAMLDPNTVGGVVSGVALLLMVVLVPAVVTSRNRSWRRLARKLGGKVFNSGIDLSISVPLKGATVDVYNDLHYEERRERIYRAEAKFLSPPGPVFEITRGFWPGEGYREGVQVGWIRDFDKKFVVLAKDDVNLRLVWNEERQRALMNITVGMGRQAQITSDGETVT